MTKRRAHGDGTVHQRADGRWAGAFTTGFKNGERIRKYVYAKTQSEASSKLREAQRQSALGLALPDERTTVAGYLTWWVQEVAPGNIKASTAVGYSYMINRYVIPHIGHIRLSKLSPANVHSMQKALLVAGLSPRTVRQARAILRKAIAHAETWGLVVRNVVALVESPRVGAARIDDALSLEEAKTLLSSASGDRLEALVSVALAIGLRKGEALALQWSNVDLDARTVEIRGTLKRMNGVGLIIDTPKTKDSRGVVPLPDVCVRALRRHRIMQAGERLAAGPAWSDSDFVFSTPVGTPIDPRNLTRWYHAMTDKAGLGQRRFHALRHSAATLMHEQGVPIEVISETLRHAGIAITKDLYVSFRPEVERRGADAMDVLFKSS